MRRHPFEIGLADLQAIESGDATTLTQKIEITTLALGEEGGTITTRALGEDGATRTTHALGEEGGSITTFALGEEGGVSGDCWSVTTTAIDENGGDFNTSCRSREPGVSQTNPLLPDLIDRSGSVATFRFTEVPRGRWYDPPSTFGFRYAMTSDSLFTQILDFPTGFDNPFTVSVKDISLGEFSPGNSVDFTLFLGGGVSEFTVTGISPFVSDAEPTAFPIQLNFNTETASFDMYAISAPPPVTPVTSVPESSTVFGLVVFVAVSIRLLLKRE